MAYIRGIFNIDDGEFEIQSINKARIFKYNIKVVNKADSVSIIISFMNEAKEIVLDWKIKLIKEWLNRKDVRSTKGQTYRQSLDLRMDQMIKLIETEECSFDLPINEEAFFTEILYN